MLHYFVIYKPYFTLSQFTSHEGKQTLGDVFNVPKDVYPVGRLDYDSEGLLILTNDATLNQRLLHPKHKHKRAYWVQVEGSITTDALQKLQGGVSISIDGKQHRTLPCKAEVLPSMPSIPERNPPIRERKNITTSWIKLVLTEGKNRQVRRMTASVGFPTLRLIRCSIQGLSIADMNPGDIIELDRSAIYKMLFG